MLSPDSRPGPTDDDHSRPQSMPLLHRRTDGNRFQDHGEPERPNNEPDEDTSRQSSFDLEEALLEQTPLQSVKGWNSRPKSWITATPRSCRTILYFIAITFMMLGVIQFISLLFLTVAALLPDQTAYFIDHWGDLGKISQGLLHWPTEFSQDIQPIPCHSHNDYWRKVPLFSALQAGCISVEADVWLQKNELYVGHSTSSLTSNRTFKSACRELSDNSLLSIILTFVLTCSASTMMIRDTIFVFHQIWTVPNWPATIIRNFSPRLGLAPCLKCPLALK